jgi:hypothetical protein
LKLVEGIVSEVKQPATITIYKAQQQLRRHVREFITAIFQGIDVKNIEVGTTLFFYD